MNVYLYICFFSVDVVISDGGGTSSVTVIFWNRGIFRPSVRTFAAKVLSHFFFFLVFN